MDCLRPATLLIALFATGTFACRCGAQTPAPDSFPGSTDPAANGVSVTSPAGAAESGLLNREYAIWPDIIPDDIPVLEGEIEDVMEAPGSHIRIFYSSVSERQVTEYLAQLESEGFHLEYIVYVQEGHTDNSSERIARGEFDAVGITRGPYHMRLASGAGQATYDIYTAGFVTPDPKSVVTATPIVWPSDIPAQISPPANCELDALAKISSGGYQITFVCSDENVQAQFIDAMLAAGLVETDRLESDRGEIVEVTLQDNDVAVKAMGAVFPYFTIQVWPINS